MDEDRLLQNNLAEATTEMGFPAKVDTPLQREVTLEDGTTVIVEGITPNQMKNILNANSDDPEESITFKTPGEDYVKDGEILIQGVVQKYNKAIETKIDHIEITTPPTKTTYYEGEKVDLTGMVVKAIEEDGDEKEITDYTTNLDDKILTLEDTTLIVTYHEKTAETTLTINEDLITSIEVTTPPTKTVYGVDYLYKEAATMEYFDPTGMVVSAVFGSGKKEVIDNSELTFNPGLETPFDYYSEGASEVTISYKGASTTQAITLKPLIILANPAMTSANEGLVQDVLYYTELISLSFGDGTKSSVLIPVIVTQCTAEDSTKLVDTRYECNLEAMAPNVATVYDENDNYTEIRIETNAETGDSVSFLEGTRGFEGLIYEN